ncbi:SprT-like domain-containing protein [Geoalkalibacter subterraneus]|uniref:SprT-like domain-containing protein n=1 Tax=Geoalkalibacter subterraneus TaxID=483547 RepID=A0A0B5FXD9_9BACT|nr:SprT-like domain-containing protein [Geoalkalibacter subterraneus]AJF08256.1 hypothetical protein GSUB_17395 [Geoalkalibacter subterraneus]
MSEFYGVKPTFEFYEELQRAYDFFNKELFSGELPPCIITLTRRKRTLGYYSPERFVNHIGEMVDEIAMNSSFFSISPLEHILATMVHEMVHQKMHHFGERKSRGGYHNQEWADAMEEVGLMPSSTGEPGGSRTGQHVHHYILEGGQFEKACSLLLTEKFKLSWMDRFPPDWYLEDLRNKARIESMEHQSRSRAQAEDRGIDIEDEQDRDAVDEVRKMVETDPGRDIEEKFEELRKIGVVVDVDESSGKKKTNGSNRVKYSCPKCSTNVWGKPEIKILCVECNAQFAPAC